MNPFFGKDFGDGSDERVGVAGSEREQQFRKPQVWLDAGKYLLVLHLPGHDSPVDAFEFKSFDQLGKFAQRKPVHCGRAAGIDFRESLFFDGCDHDIESLSFRSIEHEQRKLAVTSDQAEFGFGGHQKLSG